MNQLPRTPATYYKQVGDNLSWLERLMDEATSRDERQNITNLLLMEILKESSQKGDTTYPTIPIVKSLVKEFDLTDARLEPGELIPIIGRGITAVTDGSLSGIIVRIDTETGDPIPLAEINPYPYPPGFTNIYLQNTAQAGKTLKLYIGNFDAIASIELTSVTFAIDLVAQTIGNLAIDIAAQSIGNVAINITTSAIMMPVDIQSSYIMMPIDIQAQYITLDIDIVAQSVTIDIDIYTQSVGIYLQPEWAALQGLDKNIYGSQGATGFGSSLDIEYTVTAGKTLYINAISFAIVGISASDAEKNNIGRAYLYNVTDDESIGVIGGNGGGSLTLQKPKAYASGTEIILKVFNGSGHLVSLYGSLLGYEVDE